MNIRKATARDFSKVDPILVEVEHHHVNLEPKVFQKIMHYDENLYLSYIHDSESCVWIAEEGQQVVGALIAQIHERADNPMYIGHRFVVVEEVSVSESFRGLGIGKKLMDKVENWASEQDIEQVQLSVWASNSNAVEFYKSLGYDPFLIRMRKNIVRSNS